MITHLKSFPQSMRRVLWLAVGMATLLPVVLHAYPPAPPHTLFGTLRNEFGSMITRTDAMVIFQADNGVTIETRVIPGLATGINYEILIPMDAGIAPDLYRPNALRPQVPFQLKVIIDSQVYLPIEMSGSYHNLGKPAESTRLDLTLGLDSDGDGLPDAWQDMVAAMHGGGLSRADITASGDVDGDGMSNYDEYIAGTYAWDAMDYMSLQIVEKVGSRSVLEFLAIDGRTYFIEASVDLREWVQVGFRVPDLDPPGEQRASFLSPDVRFRRIEALSDPDKPVIYRLGVR